jgi:hypothetical protein
MLAVGLVALALVALLVWKPWDKPEPGPTNAAVALTPPPSASPATTPTQPDVPPTTRPTIQPRPLPSPDFAPLGPAGEFALAGPPGQATVRCEYRRSARRGRILETMHVQPPIVSVENMREDVLDIKRLAWSFELQTNRLEKLFEEHWQTVARSGRQIATPVGDRAANFGPLSVAIDGSSIGPTTIFRVLVIAEWHTRNLELAGRAERVPVSYLEDLGAAQPVRSEGCRGLTRV